ncbi:hypothetical protein VP1G_06739 [Cytospora mali]|uniref:EthD domain-containing protein n=1 Tax=Cytospora mali TaxID=578113 RepID=A0A194V6F0_CYTMA|nr:hypothetical protein VP1G_06739 [Valsa mali var. pyri (nom. inval.)]
MSTDRATVPQYYTPCSIKKMFQEELNELKGGSAAGWNMAPYDVACIYWFSDRQKMDNLLNDPDWENKLSQFEKGWILQTKADIQIGTQTTYIENGKIVNTVTKEFTA